MGDFHGVSEKFSVSMLSEEGHGSERIRVEIGLGGLVISSPDGYRVLKKYPLNHIARWALRGSTLVLYTKSPGDVEELTLTLQGDQRTITSILDTLTCSCMQMVELLQSKESTQDTTEVTNSLTLLLNGDSKTKKSQLPLVEEVEFWRDAEKQGWMHSQGEVVKTWRRRWFILKQGFLFRFSSPDVSSASKPRGVVDLSKVTDVSEAREQTGRINTFKLSTETGYVAYVADSETELVEWISALEGAVGAIVRKIAGVEHEPPPKPAPKAAVPRDDWSRQLEKVYSSAGSGSGHRSSARDSNPMVKIVGYDAPAQPSRSDYGSQKYSENGSYSRQPSRSEYNEYAGSLNQGNISGIAGVARESTPVNPGSTYSDSFTRSEYPAYPVLAPSGSSNYSQSYPSGPSRGADPGNTAPSYGGNAGSQHPGSVPQYQSSSDYRGYGQQQGYGAEKAYPAPPQAPQGSGSWGVHYTDEGRAYYHNSVTGQTQWEVPQNGA